MTHLIHRVALGCIALGCSFAAAAQPSSVQISGQIGISLATKTHQGAGNVTQVEVSDNTMWNSFLRFSGNEDLGGGYRALFRLEQGLNPDTGAAGANNPTGAKLWNRQSWVGLQLPSVGVITLGRQFHASTDRAIRTFDVHNLGGSALHVTPIAAFGVNRFSGADTRVDNSIKYRGRAPGGFEFGASAGAGEGVTGSSYSFDVAQGDGKNYEVGAMYVHYNSGTYLSNGVLPELSLWAVGGNLKIGNFSPYLSYFDNTYGAATVPNRPDQRNKIIDIGLAWDITPVLRLSFAGYFDRGENLNGVVDRNGKKRTYVLYGAYTMSKRTELNIAFYDNSYTDGYKLETLNLAALNRNPTASSTGGMSIGMRHLF